ncbi:unnamed protein product [Rotaria socialis]|uniref:RING-type E3 ubiquitin transferase n=1 Tax=Rotaria socialis TaxID=392032 RepID=A0A817Y9A8_9BILA|nr:unnamed protein product [Rotaria socialis]CAF3377645.1 unnamed protein product [Rotaria socialis]CAF3404665.1 unnamed protein product [Rotaria socialis]CAF3438413.1 unnamed protein product [Rotaria socialis]CAF3454255.1 unnamed protein product [Rotaria socialis]
MQPSTSGRIALTNSPQHASRMSQFHILHDKFPVGQEQKYEISPVDIKQKHLVNLFLTPYYNTEILSYNLHNDQECAICFEPFCRQDTVARLECLCIYHKKCLDEWGQRKRCCPLHMDKIVLTNLNKFNSSNQFLQEQNK